MVQLNHLWVQWPMRASSAKRSSAATAARCSGCFSDTPTSNSICGKSCASAAANAYNGAPHVAIVGLAAEGYRVARESHHFRAVQSLEFTLGCDSKLIARVDAFRKKRN